MKSYYPELSIVTVNYNGYADTCDLIESLIENETLSYELIVVDNSIQSETQKIKEKYPHVNCIRSDKNEGFAAACNIGIRAANADLIMLLNNDALVPKNSFIHLIERINSDSSIGAVSPIILSYEKPHKIQFAGYTELSTYTIRNEVIGSNKLETDIEDTASLIPYCHGACLLFKREVVEKCGYLPELYFLYYEEMDWCVSMRKAGYHLYCEPKSHVYHKESSAVGLDSPLKVFYTTRNRMLFAQRNRFGITKFISMAYLLTIATPRTFVLYLLKGKIPQAIAAMRAGLAYIRYGQKPNRYE